MNTIKSNWLLSLILAALLPMASLARTPPLSISYGFVNSDNALAFGVRFSTKEAAGKDAFDRTKQQWIEWYGPQYGSYFTYSSTNNLTGQVFYCDSRDPQHCPDYYALYGSVREIWECPSPENAGAHFGLPSNFIEGPPFYVTQCSTPEVKKSKNVCNAQCTVGDPINLAQKSQIQIEEDYRGSAGGPIEFKRFYSSGGFGDESQNRTLGYRWRHTYDRTVVGYVTQWKRDTSPYPLVPLVVTSVFRPNGRILEFTLTNGIWVADSDVNDSLVQTVDGFGTPTGWIFTDAAAKTTETFDISGKLLSTVNISGISQTLEYSTSTTSPAIAPAPGLLISVTDNFGKRLQFTYDSSKRIHTLTDPAGGVFTYTYNSNNMLESVTYPDNKTRTYVYGESPSMQGVTLACASVPATHLTGIVDENGNRFANFCYDSSGRAVGGEHAGGVEAIAVAYTENSSGDVTFATTVDALGTQSALQFEFKVGVVKNTGLSKGGNSLTKWYDANGNLDAQTDFNGNLTCYRYDLSRNLETIRVEGFAPGSTCPVNLSAYTPTAGSRQRKIQTSWHATFRLPTSITEAGHITSFSYDTGGNLLSRTVTDTATNETRAWMYTYNSFGQVLTENGPRTDLSDMTTYTYYTCTTGSECGQIHTVTNALNQVTTFDTYNFHGQPTQTTDPNGVVETFGYDSRQRLTAHCANGALPTCSGGELTAVEYWPTGLLKKITMLDGSYTAFVYDNAHRLTQVADGLGNHVDYSPDLMGNVTGEMTYDPLGALSSAVSRQYDTLSQLWKQIGAAGTAAVTTTFGYDANGNQTSIAAPLGRNSSVLFDELNRARQVIDPLSGITEFAYDANDNLVSVTDPRNLTTTYAYNGFGDVVSFSSPDTGATSNSYDSGGNLMSATDARSAVATYSYDSLNRVTQIQYSQGVSTDQTFSFTYDTGTHGKGRLTGAADANHSLEWSYDAQGRVTSRNQTIGGGTLSTGYSYTNGQLTTLTTPSGQEINYTYSNGRPASISINGSAVLNSVGYEPFGAVRRWSWGNSTNSIRLYDADGLQSQISGPELLTFSRDDAARFTGVSNSSTPQASWSYSYDDLDRLNSASGASGSLGWTYDAIGNRQTQTGAVAPSPGNVSFIYNYGGRLASVTKNAVSTTYDYNALGERIRKISPATGTTVFMYDEQGHLIGEYTGSGDLVQEILWLGDLPVALVRPAGSGVETFYVHSDHQGTPRLVTRPSDNAIRWRWDADPFGTAAPNQNPQGLGAFALNLRFPGQYFDAEIGHSYNYFRNYDPATGRYVQSDPIGLDGGLNTYAYAGGSPTNSIDPFGLAPPRGRSNRPSNPYAVPQLFPPPSAESQRVAGLQLQAALKKIAQVASCLQFGICAFNEGGSATSPAPYSKDDEAEALAFVPDPFGGDEACRRLADAIRVLRARVGWRKTDLNPGSTSYATHAKRIAILNGALRKLEEAHRNICGRECPP